MAYHGIAARIAARQSGKPRVLLYSAVRAYTTAVGAQTYPSHHFSTEQTAVQSNSRREAIRNAKPFSAFLTDTFQRQHDYLRISITEKCNLRCLYCMPEEGVPQSPPPDLLTTPEIFLLSSTFVSQGVTKIRLTGGEPTVRRDILPLMHQIGSLRSKGLRELCLTTNGISLHRKLDSMVEAGLTGINLSLDTLDPWQFQIMTRRKGFDMVMKSIDRILEMNKLGAGIKLKINCVVMRGMNDQEILPFVELGREQDLEVRFIEYMPFDGNKWSEGKMLPFQDMLDVIRAKYPALRKVQDHKNDTSKTYEVPGFVGRIGFITSMTHNFCGSCNRLRITSDGNLKVCLFGNDEVSLRDILRKSNDGNPIDEAALEALRVIEINRQQGSVTSNSPLGSTEHERELLEVIGLAVKGKKEKHAGIGELENMKNRPMILIDNTFVTPNVWRSPGRTWLPTHLGPYPSAQRTRCYSTQTPALITLDPNHKPPIDSSPIIRRLAISRKELGLKKNQWRKFNPTSASINARLAKQRWARKESKLFSVSMPQARNFLPRVLVRQRKKSGGGWTLRTRKQDVLVEATERPEVPRDAGGDRPAETDNTWTNIYRTKLLEYVEAKKAYKLSLAEPSGHYSTEMKDTLRKFVQMTYDSAATARQQAIEAEYPTMSNKRIREVLPRLQPPKGFAEVAQSIVTTRAAAEAHESTSEPDSVDITVQPNENLADSNGEATRSTDLDVREPKEQPRTTSAINAAIQRMKARADIERAETLESKAAAKESPTVLPPVESVDAGASLLPDDSDDKRKLGLSVKEKAKFVTMYNPLSIFQASYRKRPGFRVKNPKASTWTIVTREMLLNDIPLWKYFPRHFGPTGEPLRPFYPIIDERVLKEHKERTIAEVDRNKSKKVISRNKSNTASVSVCQPYYKTLMNSISRKRINKANLNAARSRPFSSCARTAAPRLTHLTPSGSAHMVDIAEKDITSRTATAKCIVCFSNGEVLPLIKANHMKKGDVLGVARIAGIMAAKKTSDLIPLCHPIAITNATVELEMADPSTEELQGQDVETYGAEQKATKGYGSIEITASVSCDGKTGVEMEALTACSAAALTVYDMCKAVDKGMRIENLRVVRKSGGRSGDYYEKDTKV